MARYMGTYKRRTRGGKNGKRYRGNKLHRYRFMVNDNGKFEVRKVGYLGYLKDKLIPGRFRKNPGRISRLHRISRSVGGSGTPAIMGYGLLGAAVLYLVAPFIKTGSGSSGSVTVSFSATVDGYQVSVSGSITTTYPGATITAANGVWGDGSTFNALGTGLPATHIYTTADVYLITITGTDSKGDVAAHSVSVTVGTAAPPPVTLTGPQTYFEGFITPLYNQLAALNPPASVLGVAQQQINQWLSEVTLGNELDLVEVAAAYLQNLINTYSGTSGPSISVTLS
jgi:hypothetical protein